MSGARLQIAGQMRAVFPYVARETLDVVSLSLVSGGLSQESQISYTKPLPFDLGPDKSGRVFVSFNGLFIRVSADSFATPPRLTGLIYYKTIEGRQINLTIIDSVFSANFSESNPNLLIVPETSFNAESFGELGYFGFQDINSSLGSATAITVAIRANIGLYGEYGEDNLEDLLKPVIYHEHSGLPMEIVE